MSNYTLLHRWFDEVWHKGNENAIDELLDENAVIHGLEIDSELTGPAAFKPFFRNFRESFPSIRVELDHLIEVNDFETAYCTVTGKNVKGQEVNFNGIVVCKFKDGKMIEAWNAFDFLKMYQQTGHRLISEEQLMAQ
jgi:predicted ester cyclase